MQRVKIPAGEPVPITVGQGKAKQDFTDREVLYIEGESNYSRFVRNEAPPALASISLVSYEKRFPHFIRIHKRFLVNPAFVEGYTQQNRKELTLLLANGQRLQSGRRKIAETLRRLHN